MGFLDIKNPSFSGHETFTFRYAWLKKGVDYVQRYHSLDPDIAMVELGVGKNMVRSIRHWCLILDLISQNGRTYTVTDLGKLLLEDRGFDPYLEDIGTIWLIHWIIASNPKATTWYWAFNHFHQYEFTKERFAGTLVETTNVNGTNKISENTIRRDIDCFIRTYVPSGGHKSNIIEDTLDCPLAELGLLSEMQDRRTFRFHRGNPKNLPDEIFAYTVQDYWERSGYQNRESLSFGQLTHNPGAPGRVFILDENGMAIRLEGLEKVSKGAFTYDETNGLKQVYRHKRNEKVNFLKNYYLSKN